MVFPQDDRVAQPSESSHKAVLTHFSDELAARIDFQQMFILVDGVLPFEACLYYQVLPLYLEGSRLMLGMVSPDDRGASDYVRRIISYHHYIIVPRQISSDALQSALSAYLNYAGTHASISRTHPPEAAPFPKASSRSRSEQRVDHNIQPTLVVDSPEDLDRGLDDFLAKEAEAEAHAHPPVPAPEAVRPPVAPVPPAMPTPASPVEAKSPPATPATPSPSKAKPAQHSPQPAPRPAPEPVLMGDIPLLKLDLHHLTSPAEVLKVLPPATLFQELLGRVLVGGIGRLYLERQKDQGRVLWSQNGVLQLVLDDISLDQFQGLIGEMKHFADLSLVPINHPKHVDLERIFRRTRLMMRFRFMLSNYGEEATIQVLRGAALRFYQQQQLALLERDALGIAKQLQNKLTQLRDRAYAESKFSGARLEVLPALSQLLKTMEAQIHTIQDGLPVFSDDDTQPLPPPPSQPSKPPSEHP